VTGTVLATCSQQTDEVRAGASAAIDGGVLTFLPLPLEVGPLNQLKGLGRAVSGVRSGALAEIEFGAL